MRRVLAALLASVLLSCGGGGGGGGGAGSGSFAVMTRNLYLGAPLDPLFDPAIVANPPAAVGSLWRAVQASDPPARMAKVAEEIAARRPDLVGLQEASLFRTAPLLAPTAETTVYDFVELVLAELRRRGLDYAVAATSTNFDQQLPIPTDDGVFVRLVDRDVVLARAGVATSDPRDGRFAARVQLAVAGQSVAIPRGWTSVRAEVAGGPIRFWNTHLEAVEEPTRAQEAQAQELVQLLAAEQGPVVLVGDLNSPADRTGTQSYALLRAAGLDDAWERTRAGEPGLTCCFAGDLRSGAFTSRIDDVLFRGALEPLSAEIVGEEAGDRTASGLAPSDHAGVFATLRAR